MILPNFIRSSASFCPERVYRWTLHRLWDDRPPLVVIGLNPSTADEARLDPTVTRCCRRAHLLGYGGLVMLNLFALRSTDPNVMKRHPEPIGAQNDAVILRETAGRDVLCGWGNDGGHLHRSNAVLALLAANTPVGASLRLFSLGRLTTMGEPRHPLYVGYDTPLTPLWPLEKILRDQIKAT